MKAKFFKSIMPLFNLLNDNFNQQKILSNKFLNHKNINIFYWM